MGVTYWDVEFTGAVDEVKVYDRTLSEGEVYRLYDPETPAEELLERDGITVTESMNMVLGRTQQIELSMNQIAADSNPEITFESADPKVAEVSEDGLVTAGGSRRDADHCLCDTGRHNGKGNYKRFPLPDPWMKLWLPPMILRAAWRRRGRRRGRLMLVTGLNSYVGQAAYDKGRDGQAVRLGDYGLKLNLNDLGTEYTVSMWVRSDEPLAGNQVMLFMGYHDPENWLAISGDSGDKLKFWANGGIGQWVTLASPVVPSAQWHQITVTGTEGSTTLYLDGITMEPPTVTILWMEPTRTFTWASISGIRNTKDSWTM